MFKQEGSDQKEVSIYFFWYMFFFSQSFFFIEHIQIIFKVKHILY